MRATSAEHKVQAALRQQETKDLEAELQVSKSETARYSSELETSSKGETLLKKDLETIQLTIHEGRLRIEELCTKLTDEVDENALDTTITENLAAENSRLQQELEKALLHHEETGALEDARKDNALLRKVEELRDQAVAERNRRCVLILSRHWIIHFPVRVARSTALTQLSYGYLRC